VTTLIYTSTNGQWVRPACPLVRSSKTKLCQFISVQLRRSVYTFGFGYLEICLDALTECAYWLAVSRCWVQLS